MLQGNRFMLIAASLALVGGTVFAVTSTAATRPVTVAPAAEDGQSAMDRASVAALAKVPGGTVKKSEIECEDGKMVYTFDIASSGGTVKVSVDAATGLATLNADDDEEEDGVRGAEKKGHHEEEDDDEDDDDQSCNAGSQSKTARR